MKLFLDDLRPCPEGWTYVSTADVANDILLQYEEDIQVASLDFDLGQDGAWMLNDEGEPVCVVDPIPDAGEGIEVVEFMAEFHVWPNQILAIHTATTLGRIQMCKTIEKHGPYDVRARGLVGSYPAIIYAKEGVLS